MPDLVDNEELYDEILSKLKPVDQVKCHFAVHGTCRNIIKTAFHDFALFLHCDEYDDAVLPFIGDYLFIAVYQPSINDIEQLGFPKDITNMIRGMLRKYLFIIVNESKRGRLYIEYLSSSHDWQYLHKRNFDALLNQMYLIKLMQNLEYYDTQSDLIERYNEALRKLPNINERFAKVCNKGLMDLLGLDDDSLLYKIE